MAVLHFEKHDKYICSETASIRIKVQPYIHKLIFKQTFLIESNCLFMDQYNDLKSPRLILTISKFQRNLKITYTYLAFCKPTVYLNALWKFRINFTTFASSRARIPIIPLNRTFSAGYTKICIVIQKFWFN